MIPALLLLAPLVGADVAGEVGEQVGVAYDLE